MKGTLKQTKIRVNLFVFADEQISGLNKRPKKSKILDEKLFEDPLENNSRSWHKGGVVHNIAERSSFLMNSEIEKGNFYKLQKHSIDSFSQSNKIFYEGSSDHSSNQHIKIRDDDDFSKKNSNNNKTVVDKVVFYITKLTKGIEGC